MPEKWLDRMHTIETYEKDSSAMARINAWETAFNVAKDRPLGGGFEMASPSVFARYAPDPSVPCAAHSIYFQVLGEHGFPGLGLFLLLWLLVWRDTAWIISRSGTQKEFGWASDLARMIQVSLVGYFVGGAFLSLAYYDVPYKLLVAVVLTRLLVEKELKGLADRKLGAIKIKYEPIEEVDDRLARGRAMILDTCALLFLASGDRRLSRSTRQGLATQAGRWFCAISSFEIALKHRQLRVPVVTIDPKFAPYGVGNGCLSEPSSTHQPEFLRSSCYGEVPAADNTVT